MSTTRLAVPGLTVKQPIVFTSRNMRTTVSLGCPQHPVSLAHPQHEHSEADCSGRLLAGRNQEAQRFLSIAALHAILQPVQVVQADQSLSFDSLRSLRTGTRFKPFNTRPLQLLTVQLPLVFRTRRVAKCTPDGCLPGVESRVVYECRLTFLAGPIALV